MKRLFLILFAFVLVAVPLLSTRAADWMPLFNGKDLTGWHGFLVDPAVKTEQVWSVRDGLLVCKGEPMGYLYTDRKFTNFELVVEWRWAPGTKPGNSGVLMRINGEHQGLPRCIEAQLKSGDAGNLYGFRGMRLVGDPDRSSHNLKHETLGQLWSVEKKSSNENPPGEWNRYDIRLQGSDLTVTVNGKLLNTAHDCTVENGYLGLQSEGGEVHFRKVEIKPLDSK